MKTKENKIKKHNLKRQISIITVFLWIFLVATMVTIVTKSVKNTNALEGVEEEQVHIRVYKNWNTTGSVGDVSYISESFWKDFESTGIDIELYQDGTLVHTEKLSSRDNLDIDLGYWPKYNEAGFEYYYDVYENMPSLLQSYSYSFNEPAIEGADTGVYYYQIYYDITGEIIGGLEANNDYIFKMNNNVSISGTRDFIRDTSNEQVNIKARKIWETEDSDDSLTLSALDKFWEIFESTGITVELYQNGKYVTSNSFSNRENYFEVDLGYWPKYRGDGLEYVYEVKEIIPGSLATCIYGYPQDIYEYTVTVSNTSIMQTSGMGENEYIFYVYNSIGYTTSVAVNTIHFDINVEWIGDGGNPRFRPSNVNLTFDLTGDNNIYKRYTYTSTSQGCIDTVDLEYSKYSERPYYSILISQDYIEGYYMDYTTEEIDDEHVKVNITNTFNNDQTIQGRKTWVGDSSEDRPYSVTIWLLQDGEQYDRLTTTSSNNWNYTFNNIPILEDGKQNSGYENGHVFEYTLEEEPVEGYNVSYEGFNVINTLKEQKIIEAVKVWDDNDNVANKRPSSIELQLKSNGNIVDYSTVGNYNDWKHTFKVPKYDELGNEIQYTVDERDLNSTISKFYEKHISGNTITNKFKVPDEKVNVEVIKVFDDEENKLGKRPDSIILQVKNNGAVVAEQVVNSGNNWRHTFELPKYDELGNEITYTVDEKYINESISKFYIKNIVGNTITNKFVIPEDRVKIIGTKVWNDNDNVGGKRDLNVILQLKIGDNVVSEAEVSENTNWSYEFEAPKYDELGNEIEYYIDEKDNENRFYKKILTDKNTVTNEFVVPEEITLIKAVKKWEDNNDEYSKRPRSVVLQVFNKDKLVAEEKVSADNNWSYEFEVPKYDELGNEIEYTIDEKDIPKYYEKSINGYTVINKCIYEPSIDTSDINIFVYILIFLVAIVGIIIGTIFIKKKK